MVKAGPKKRRAKKDEADLIREAIEEHGRRGRVKPSRKAGKVNSFKYKETDEAAKKQRAKSFVSEQERMYGLRVPDGPSEFDVFLAALPADQRVFGRMYWHMQCDHKHERAQTISASLVEGVSPIFMECPACGLVRRWHGTRTETKRQEWIGYCPDGYDMFDWTDLFTRDRSLWQFIHDECQAEMAEAAMTDEEDA